LLIKGDSAVTYQEVLRAMDVARGAGVIIIGLLGKDLKVPTSLPDIDLSFTRTMPEALPLATSGRCRHPGDDPAGSRAVAGGVPSDALPYFEFQVEKAAKQIPGTGAVKYPDALRPSGMQGQVLVQFVVDAEGKGEPDSFKIIKTSHALFSEAAHAAFLEMRFTPAMVRGKAVRQVVQQPFTFSTAP
ncbi:MAG: energy transducer TonB, partial [bacterium]